MEEGGGRERVRDAGEGGESVCVRERGKTEGGGERERERLLRRPPKVWGRGGRGRGCAVAFACWQRYDIKYKLYIVNHILRLYERARERERGREGETEIETEGDR